MNKNCGRWLTIVMLSGIATATAAQTSAPVPETAAAMSVQDAAVLAVRTNPEVQAAWHEFQAAEDARNVARGGYFPRLDLSARAGREEQEFPDANTTLEFDPQGVSLTLTQMLWDGLFTRSETKRADYVRRTRYFELRNAAEATALEAFRAYQDVQRFRELVQLAELNYNSHREVYNQIEDRVRAGISRSVDLEQVTGRLALAQSNLITETSNLHDVSARFERVVGTPPPPALANAPELGGLLPDTLGEALNTAYAEHPAIIASVENIQAREFAIDSAEAAYWPRLDLRIRGEQGDDIDRLTGRTNDVIGEVVLSYNLLNGGSDRAAVAQAVDQTKTAEYLRDKTCRDVRQGLRIAYNDAERLQVQLKQLNVHRLSTEKTREVYRNQFSIGQRTLLDLLDTENEAFDSRRAYAEARYDQSIATARSLASMGRLLAALEISRSDMDAAGGRLGADKMTRRDQMCPHLPEAQMLVAAKPAPVIIDSDGDGVPDDRDLCPGTKPGVEVDEFGCEKRKPIILKGVNFKLNSADLLPESRSILDKAVKSLEANPGARIEIVGHTDSTGSDAYNLALSDRRAASVVRYLRLQGIAASRMTSIGMGESQPIASNQTAEGRSQNRRVEFRVKTPQPVAPGPASVNPPAP